MTSCREGGTYQWMGPELLEPERFGFKNSRPTMESDCYALGMVIYEVLSGRAPFHPWKLPRIMQKVLNGERPLRPQGQEGVLFTNIIWETLEHCWKHEPSQRMSAKNVLLGLEGDPSAFRTSSLTVGRDETPEVDDPEWDVTSDDSSEFSCQIHPEFLVHFYLIHVTSQVTTDPNTQPYRTAFHKMKAKTYITPCLIFRGMSSQ